MNQEVKKAALRLAEANALTEKRISSIYVFPSDEEVRLIEVYADAIPSNGAVEPFYFAADPSIQIPFPSGIALIRPEEVRKVKLPAEWGTWDDAIAIWSRPERINGRT